ncbi:unnamed protein product [Schistosoma margrebowiei]|uniref:Uncharacterized protein n=1 Tax=Schistosoma margrebowiei TaxID=48269 RepID=A0A183LQC3_9TREM|nr:unnamed protein product [Schistosoma margrebowiei]
MKISTSRGMHEIQWTARIQLSNLNFADHLALLSHTQQQMRERTTSVAAASAAIEAQINRQSKFLSNIEAEEKWLNDIENKINQDHNHSNNCQSTAELLQDIQTKTDRYNQLLSNVNTHDQQIDEQLLPEAQSLKDSLSLQRIDNLKGNIKNLKQNLEKMFSDMNTQATSIHNFQQAVENFRFNLKNFERQRSSILEIQTVSYVNMESDCQLLETSYVNMKNQIENLLTNQSELKIQLNHIEYLSQFIQSIPNNNDFNQCQHEMEQFFNKLHQNFNEIQLILLKFIKLNELIKNFKNFLNNNHKQFLFILNKQSIISINYDLNQLLQFYQLNLNEIQFICNNFGIELSCESSLKRNQSCQLSIIENEINNLLNDLIQMDIKHSTFFISLKNDLYQQINQLTNDLFNQLNQLTQLNNNLNILFTYYYEGQNNIDLIQKEYQTICLKENIDCYDELIQSINQLINQLQIKMDPIEITLNKTIENIDIKYSSIIINNILTNYLKQFINKKDLLINNMKETIELYKQSNEIVINYINHFNQLNNELNQLKNSFNQLSYITMIDQINNIDFNQQLNMITEQYTILYNRYNNLYENFNKTNIKSYKINELLSMNSSIIQQINENLIEFKQNYELHKNNYEFIQNKLNQSIDYLNQYQLEIQKIIDQFMTNSMNNLSLEQIINNLLIDFTEYKNDLNTIQQIINKNDENLIDHKNIKKMNDLYQLIIEIIQLNKTSVSSLSSSTSSTTTTTANQLVNWNNFLNHLNNLIEWIENTTNEFKVIQLNYQKLLNKIEQFNKNYDEISKLIDEKSQHLQIDLNYLIQNQKSIKSIIMNDLNNIKQYQLFNLMNNFQSIKQQSNQLFNKPQSTNIKFKFMDDHYIQEFITQMEQSLQLLSNQLNDNIIKCKILLTDEYEINKLYKSIQDWIISYENDVKNIEDNISEMIIEPKYQQQLNLSPTHKTIEKHLSSINNIEENYSQGENLIDIFMNKFNQYDELCNNIELKELHNRITTLDKSRINNIKTNLLQIKSNLDNLTSKGNDIDEQLTKYEQSIEKSKQTSMIFKINKLEDLLIEETFMDTMKWNDILIELEGFKRDILDPYEILHNKATLKPSKDYVNNFKLRYDKCLAIVKDKIKEFENYTLKLKKLKQNVEDFNRSLEGANIKYKTLTNQFKIEFDEQYTHCKLSEICQSVMKIIQQTIVNLKEYDLNIIGKLQTIEKDISSQVIECELKSALEDSFMFDRFISLKTELTDYTNNLNELYNQLNNLNTDIVNYEQWFDNLDKQYQQTKIEYTIENILLNKSNLYQSITDISIHELEKESNHNSTHLAQFHLQYQKLLQTLYELRKLFLEYNPSINILSEKLLTFIRQIINIHKSFTKINIHNHSNEQMIINPIIYGIDIIEQNCNHIKQCNQYLINNINYDINIIQIKLTYFNQLIQSNKDLDLWIKDILQLINQIKQDNNEKNQYYNDNHNHHHNRIDEIQLKLDIGKTYLKSIHEWIEQLKQQEQQQQHQHHHQDHHHKDQQQYQTNEINTLINDLLNQQYKRSEQIYQYIIQLINNIKNQQNQYNELIKTYEIEYNSYENWFKQWKNNLYLIQLNITKLFINLKQFNKFHIIDIEINRFIDSLNELNKELFEKQTALLKINNNHNHNELINKFNLNQSYEKNFLLLINEIKENQYSIEEIINCLKCIKIKLKELIMNLKNSKQWIEEISEQFSRIKEGKNPIKISPYPSKNDSNKLEYWKTNNSMNTQLLLTNYNEKNELQSITPSPSPSSSSSSFLIDQLLKQSHFKMDLLQNFINEINKTSSIIADNINHLLNELENDLLKLNINDTIIIDEIHNRQNSIEQLLIHIIDYKNDLNLFINQLNQFNNKLNEFKQSFMNYLIKIKKINQQSINNMNNLSINQLMNEKNNQLMIDIYYPLDEIIQNYQVISYY